MHMMNNERPTPNRIPVRFVEDESAAEATAVAASGDETDAPGGLTPDEIGRASSYEDATEMQRRIDRGEEEDSEAGRERADEHDTAGAPPRSELPEKRDEQDTNQRGTAGRTPPPATSQPTTSPNSNSSGGRSPVSASAEAEMLAAQAELSIIEEELRKAKAERQELHDSMARRQADFDNYRKRMERDRSETYQRVVADVAAQLLPVVDNLRRALDAEASNEATESEEFRHFLHGIELIGKQLDGVLGKLGVEPVATVGLPFDPHVHEAIATEQTDEFEADTVTREVQRGYRLGDKLLRPAMVKVATR